MESSKRKQILIAGLITLCLMTGWVLVIPAAATDLALEENLPGGFISTVIGNPGEHAESTYDHEEKAFFIEGTGLGIGDEGEAADSYHFVSYELSGDASLSACLSAYEIQSAKEGQFGIAFRFDAGSVKSPYLALYLEPAYHKFYVSWRQAEGEEAEKQESDTLEELADFYYFHLEKKGNNLLYEVALDAEFDNKILSGSTQILQMPSKWHAGFAVSNKGSYQSVRAVFNHVVIKSYSQIYFDSSIEQRPVDTVKNVVTESQNQAVKLSWDLVEGADGYEVYRSEESDEDFVEQAKVDGRENTFVDLAVKNYKRYFYRIVAVNQDGASHPSEIVSAFPNPSNSQKVLHGADAADFTVVSEISETVLTSELMFKGYFSSDGILNASIDGERIITDMRKEAKDPILISLELHPGRNVLELTLENEEGYLTRKQYQFVYLERQNYDYVVDSSYTGQTGKTEDGKRYFSRIQDAVEDAEGLENERYRTVIFVRKGVYNEQVRIKSPFISIIGEDSDSTIVTFENKSGGVRENAVLHISEAGTGFSAENITFENRSRTDGTATDVYQPAVVNEADQTMFIQCRILGQAGAMFAGVLDTLAARQYYRDCTVQGETVLVSGNAQAVWESCEMILEEGKTKTEKMVVAPFTRKKDRYGFLFYGCMLLKAKKLQAGSAYLAGMAPKHTESLVSPEAVFTDCYLSDHIRKEGYPEEKDIRFRFYEFANFGPGMVVSESRKQFVYEQAKNYTREQVFAEDAAFLEDGVKAYEQDWNPFATSDLVNLEMLYAGREIPLTSVTAARKQILLRKGESTELEIVFTPFNASDRTFTMQSLNERIVQIEEGEIMAKDTGVGIVLILSGERKDYVVIRVYEKMPSFFSLPVIWANDRQIKRGEQFSLLEGVHAYDNADGEITSSIEIIKNTVDIEQPGIYEVWYAVRNSQNRLTGKKIQVIVK
ncbi:MAG: DUF5011 domain-containing protein [Lachnospiraceae bacterium]|nr:DUF5011 domain-containing protein [Lachnospiraceae bacterium]